MPFSTQTQCSLKIFRTHHLAPNVGNNWREIHKYFKLLVVLTLLRPFFHFLILIKKQK